MFLENLMFKDDEAIECVNCTELINAGEDYLEFDDEPFCSDGCVAEYLYKLNRNKIYFKHLCTSYEKKEMYFDYWADNGE